MGVTKMGNTVPRAGLEPTSLAFQASVLPLHHVGSLIYVAPCLRDQCRLLHSPPWDYKSFNTFNYTHTGNGLTYAYTG